MIDGRSCYLVITDNPIVAGTELTGKQYQSYLDPTVGFMPRRVELVDALNPEKILQVSRFSKYQQLSSGLWFSKHLEVERFSPDSELSTRKNLYTVKSVIANHPLPDLLFVLNTPTVITTQVVVRTINITYPIAIGLGIIFLVIIVRTIAKRNTK